MLAIPRHSLSSLQLHSLTSNFKYAPTPGCVLIAEMLSQIPVMLERLPRRPGHPASLQGQGDHRFGANGHLDDLQDILLKKSNLNTSKNKIMT